MLAARLRVNTVGGDAKYGGTSGQSLIGHTFGGQIPSCEVRQGASGVLRLAQRQASVGRQERLFRERAVPDEPRRAQDRHRGGAGRPEGQSGQGEHLGQPERQRPELPLPELQGHRRPRGHADGHAAGVRQRRRRRGREGAPEREGGNAELLVHAQAAQDDQAAAERADPALQHRVLHDPPDQ